MAARQCAGALLHPAAVCSPSASSTSALPALARYRAIAVLDHGNAAGRGQQRRAGGKIEAAGLVAAGADDVDGARAAARSSAGAPARACAARSRAARPASRPWRAARPAAHRPAAAACPDRSAPRSSSPRLVSLSASPLQQLDRACRADVSCAMVLRAARSVQEIAASAAGPAGVSTLSGWNCTPSTMQRRWRTPMISPSGVRARDFEFRRQRVGLRRSASGSDRLRRAAAARRTGPGRHASTGEVLPCIRRGARTTLPPNTSTMD